MANPQIRFGIGGIPHTASGVENGIKRVSELGLKHMELEFVKSVFVKEDKAPMIKQLAEEQDVSLSVHGSYYTNFATEERPKFHASVSRIAKAAKIGDMCGAVSVTYHSGFFQGRTYDQVRDSVLEAMRNLLDELQKDDRQIRISPELTGKETQIGNLPQLIDLVSTLRQEGYENVALCIDFAHNYARHAGEYNSYDEFMQVFEDISTGLSKEDIQHLHMHVSAIEYGDKGEKNHLVFLSSLEEYKDAGVEVEGIEKFWDELKENRLLENKFNWRDLLRAYKAAGVGGYVVCESPILELDALLLQSYYNSV